MPRINISPSEIRLSLDAVARRLRFNGHDVHTYTKEVLERLPSLSASRIRELLPHCWVPAT
ncbi:transposase domain-containing protein [Herbaspirillum sp. RTI4]|uniref:transposase domain-containing protein n=1 Tax=Herbaspirillum sp. RTI4 TaxID=3048640 RepID=UPI003A1007F4